MDDVVLGCCTSYEVALRRSRYHWFGRLTLNHDFVVDVCSVTLPTVQKDVLSNRTELISVLH